MNWPVLRTSLLTWFDGAKRPLPWRGLGDPYQVWLAEVMAQQTTITAMLPYHAVFVARWPTVADLAAAPLDHVLSAWAGLGYYARARNLHRCAQTVAALGGFPRDVAGLEALPGIGAYTARAIAAQCFDVPTLAVDGNVERVFARLVMLDEVGPKLKARIADVAAPIACAQRPGDVVEAVMALGAQICTPKSPKCGLCPWVDACAAHRAGVMTDYPRKAAKVAKPERQGVLYVLVCGDEVYLEQRPEAGLLGGFWAPPTSAWGHNPQPNPPVAAAWASIGTVRHVFTHFALTLDVMRADVSRKPRLNGRWVRVADLRLPTVFAKGVAAACRTPCPTSCEA
jgi:A/G-specific adenine glycosylase